MNPVDPPVRAFIGLGSNLNQPGEQIRRAVTLLDDIPDTRVIQCSRIYTTTPVGPQDQPDFCNAAAEILTGLPPRQLLAQTQAIEKRLGRVKKRHWGERIIDLDILLYDNQTVCSDVLTIPHKELVRRDFVLVPLLEIDPLLSMPSGEPLARLLELISPEQRTIK